MKSVLKAMIAALVLLAASQSAHALDVPAAVAEAEALLAAGDHDGALRAANKLIEAAGADPDAWHCRCRVHMARAQDEDALADINRALQLSGRRPKDLTARAQLRLVRRAYDAAIEDADAAIAADAAYAPAWQLRAKAKLRQGHARAALKDAREAVRLAPEDASAYLVRAAVFEAIHDAGKARADYVKATELEPNNAAAWYRLARHDCRNKNDSKRAGPALDKAIALDPDLAKAYVLRAQVKLATNKAAQRASALDDLTAALRLNPDLAEAYFIRAEVERAAEEYAGAVADLRRALALAPDNAAYRALWNEIYRVDAARLIGEAEKLLNDGDYDGAAGRVRKALEIDPHSQALHEALLIIEAQRDK